MGKLLFYFVLISVLFFWMGALAHSRNPFMAPQKKERVSESPGPKSTFLLKISLWQQQLKQKMAALIRQAKTEKRIGPLMLVLLLALGYGVLHAAGPGHGKAVATSFMLSRNVTLGGGLMFGIVTALFHGFSGILCVLALHYVLEKSISTGLGSVSHIMQGVSFSLIALLGLSILFKNVYALVKGGKSNDSEPELPQKTRQKSFLPWAFAMGLTPCPGVVMVLLFCMSMDALMLGLLLAVFISFGMAATISAVIIAVVLGKRYSTKFFSGRGAILLEQSMGLLSGAAITALAVLFLLSTFV